VLIGIAMIDEERRSLKKIAEKGTIPYLPLDPYFENTFDVVTFPHDHHWNPKGHEIAANAIDAFLQKIDVFGSSEFRQ